ncbi:MAG TPA: CDP-alcohol phosphatidyltransferase family protein [Rhizomicrobium sp.]|jgi:phosphatidylglycerophosphate synthase|nr:CDP-alcohol phosphatidyltransferase family protein [Rhizomicrobium sp.]
MLDAVLRRRLDGYIAPATALVAGLGVGANRLTVAAFLSGGVALFDISRRYYLVGLLFLVAARLFDVLDGRVARLNGETVFGAYLKSVLDLTVTAAIPFAFALAAPGRALAAMFLMLGLVARAGAASAAAQPVGQDPVIVYFGRVGRLVEKTELFIAFALACVFPDWFSAIAYIVGMLCFIAVGGRVATAAVHRP